MFGNISYSTFLFNNLPLEEMLRSMNELHVSHIELFGGEYTHWLPTFKTDVVNALLEKYELSCDSFHLPIEPLSGINGKDLRRNIGLLSQSIKFASAIGAKNTVLHAGLYEGSVDDINITSLKTVVKQLAKVSKDEGIDLLLENLPAFGKAIYGSSIFEIIDIIESIQMDNVFICLDTGHSHVNNNDFVEEMRNSKELIRTVHLSDNSGMRYSDPILNDAHLPLGEGNLPWDSIFFEICHYRQTINLVVETATRATKASEKAVLNSSRDSVEYLVRKMSS